MFYRAKPKLCIVSPWNYPLFNTRNATHFGGWEVRVAVIAKEIARRGKFEVSMVVGDHGQPHVECLGEIRLHSWRGRQIWGIPFPPEKTSGSQNGNGKLALFLSGVRNWIVKSRMNRAVPPIEPRQIGSYLVQPDMISIYDEIGADIYTVPGNSQFSGELAYYCEQRTKKYVFLSGSDYDFLPEYKLNPEGLDIYGLPYSLKTYAIENAQAHIVQSEVQAQMLNSGYGRVATVIHNPIDLSPLFPRNPHGRNVLWVGKSDERVKRPSILLELARRLSDYHFVMIMNRAVEDTHQACIAKAKSLSNVSIVERVPFSRIETYFADARLHLNTSAFEGFPNTFLQAAKYGVPTVSLQVDPAAMLTKHGCGLHCDGEIERMTENIRLLMTNDPFYSEKSRNALQYVRSYHDKDKIIPRYEEAFFSVME